MLKGFIMVLCYCMMSYVDYSMMYHLIRGQSVIKLYIIYNMLEVTAVGHTPTAAPPKASLAIRYMSFRQTHVVIEQARVGSLALGF